jgi:hypothetical protein
MKDESAKNEGCAVHGFGGAGGATNMSRGERSEPPVGVEVPIRIIAPDGEELTVSFTR